MNGPKNVVTGGYVKDKLTEFGGSSTMTNLVDEIIIETKGVYIRRKIKEVVRKIVVQSAIFKVEKPSLLFSDEIILLKSQEA